MVLNCWPTISISWNCCFQASSRAPLPPLILNQPSGYYLMKAISWLNGCRKLLQISGAPPPLDAPITLMLLEKLVPSMKCWDYISDVSSSIFNWVCWNSVPSRLGWSSSTHFIHPFHPGLHCSTFYVNSLDQELWCQLIELDQIVYWQKPLSLSIRCKIKDEEINIQR